MQIDWQQPNDEFGRLLAIAYATMRANISAPSHAVEAFEPILETLRYAKSRSQSRLVRVKAMGRELFDTLRTLDDPVAMEIRHYCWHLQSLGESGPSSLTDMLVVTLTQFAHYDGHCVKQCPLCEEFPQDIPFQGSPHGQEHLTDWIRRRS